MGKEGLRQSVGQIPIPPMGQAAPCTQLNIFPTLLFLLSYLQDHFCQQLILQTPSSVLLCVPPIPTGML